MNVTQMPTSYYPTPTIFEQGPGGMLRAWSIDSKMLEEERTIFLTGPFNDALAHSLVQQLMYLKSKVTEGDTKPVVIYINSPGGQVTSGMAIYDIIQNFPVPVQTVAMGLAASMGSFILMAGTKGHRYIFPNAEVMVHQPSGGAQGKVSDIEISYKWIQATKEKMTNLYVQHCGGTKEQWDGLLDRDTWLTAEKAKELGLVDHIIS